MVSPDRLAMNRVLESFHGRFQVPDAIHEIRQTRL